MNKNRRYTIMLEKIKQQNCDSRANNGRGGVCGFWECAAYGLLELSWKSDRAPSVTSKLDGFDVFSYWAKASSSMGSLTIFANRGRNLDEAVLIVATRFRRSFPGWRAVTRPKGHLQAGYRSSLIKTTSPTWSDSRGLIHLLRCWRRCSTSRR